jgi:probable F420-dependent oxidoreductase
MNGRYHREEKLMKIGVIYPQTELQGDPEAVRRIGLATEELGFDHLLVYDHVLGATHDREPKLAGPYTEKQPFHDPFVMFAYLAAITQRIELVTGILILPQRQTALVARQAADLDLLSHERFRLGVGIGWNYVEYDSLGQDFRSRGKRVDEQITLLRRLWSEPLVTFDGAFDHIDRAALNPRPRRNIPIWLGGFADVALQRAAAVGDGFIFADGAADAFAQVSRLRQLLKDAGRSEDSFGLHCNMLKAKSAQAVVETVSRWRDIGGTHACVSTMGQNFTTTDQHLDYMKAVAAALRDAGL